MVTKYFLFKSIKRHTRWPRDWSSDVCSSDLGESISVPGTPDVRVNVNQVNLRSFDKGRIDDPVVSFAGKGERRSEERGVGKEGRDGIRQETINMKGEIHVDD